jgi:hypothetical protein
MSARELALDLDRWAVSARRERGDAEQLPDLAVWLDPAATPGAVIAESGGRREDRQKMILDGWRDAIWSGRYFAVRYDCASEPVARWITRLATKIGLTSSAFTAVVPTFAEQITALSPRPHGRRAHRRTRNDAGQTQPGPRDTSRRNCAHGSTAAERAAIAASTGARNT